MLSSFLGPIGILLLVCLVGGLFAGIVGIVLRNKFADHPREDMIVLGGILAAALVFTGALAVICNV